MIDLSLANPKQETDEVIEFIRQTYQQQRFKRAVIGVSGGIDSALSLSLLVKALGPEKVLPVFMPYRLQSVEDAKLICSFNEVPEDNWQQVEITQMVEVAFEQLLLDEAQLVRRGNIMARMRMIVLFDLAKKKQALVCGTENKSENLLGYFTRYGDEASDLEPIVHLYKTQVRQLASYLSLPEQFLQKAPSAGLWEEQTDELEFGFSYEQADQVLAAMHEAEYQLEDLELGRELIERVVSRVEAFKFKHQVPYQLRLE